MSKNFNQLEVLLQVIGDWVASPTQTEVLAVMAEARVPSGAALLLSCFIGSASVRV